MNPTDCGLRARGIDDLPPPWTPGMDAAGTIESVGPGVTRLAVGDRVMATVMPRRADGGAQAELLVVPAASVVAVPEGASLAEAATLPMNGLTAMRGLELLDLEGGRDAGGQRRRRPAGLLRDRARQGARACGCSPTPSPTTRSWCAGSAPTS